MFDYCVARLQMSEDEACRRIELARLARRFPELFSLLAAGEISLSVALLLKPVLSPENHVELLAAARGHSLRQARELLAARFPKPDVPSSIRKLPDKPAEIRKERAASVGTSATRPPVASEPPELAALSVTTPSEPNRNAQQPTLLPPYRTATLQATSTGASPLRETPAPALPSSRIEPLSPRRYKIQLTADAALKEKLEQARDLLRHAHPSGDLAEILSRALDLLIADQLRRRFGAGVRRAQPQTTTTATTVPPGSTTPDCPPAPRTFAPPSRPPGWVPRASRREVLQRDGLRCTWVSAEGHRCNASAWLELDHRQPRGKGGGSEPENLRILCRAHNHFAAEREYGREHIRRATAARQQARSHPDGGARLGHHEAGPDGARRAHGPPDASEGPRVVTE
jgi:hypothetical protein